MKWQRVLGKQSDNKMGAANAEWSSEKWPVVLLLIPPRPSVSGLCEPPVI